MFYTNPTRKTNGERQSWCLITTENNLKQFKIQN